MVVNDGDEYLNFSWKKISPTSAFGVKISEGENQNQNKPNSKKTNENKIAEEDGSRKKRRFAMVQSENLDSSARELYQNTTDNKCNNQFRLSLTET